MTGPIDVAGIARSYVNSCVDRALHQDEAEHIVEALAALASDIYAGTGGAAISAKVADYINSVRRNALSCLTSQSQLTDFIKEKVSMQFNATVQNESHWIYWRM